MCPLSSVTGLLHAAERRAERGQRCAVLLYGPPGVGKTTLLESLLLDNKTLNVGLGKAEQFGCAIPYRPVLEAIRQATTNWLKKASPSEIVALKERVSGLEDVLANLIPELAHWTSQRTSLTLAPDQSQRVLLAVRRLLVGLSAHSAPLVLIIDDLQWMEHETLHKLKMSLDHNELRGLVLVFSSRDDAAALKKARNLLDGLSDLGFTTNEQEIAPPKADYRQLSANTGKLEEQLAGIVGALGSRNASPLFLRYAVDFVKSGGDPGQLSKTSDTTDLFELHLSRFTPLEREVLGIIACAGRVPQGLLARAISRVSRELDVDRLAAQAEELGLVKRCPDDGTLSIAHDLLQEVCAGPAANWPIRSLVLLEAKMLENPVFDEMSDDELFWLLGQVLKSSPLLKLHYLRESAIRVAIVGSVRARARGSVEIALKAGRVAKHLLSETDEPSLRGEVYRECAIGCWVNGYTADFETMATEAEKLLSPLGLAPLVELRMQGLISLGEFGESVELALSASRTLILDLPLPDTSTFSRPNHEQALELLKLLRHSLPCPEPTVKAVSRLLTTANAAAYVGAPERLPQLVALQIKLALKHGTTERLPLTLAYWASLLADSPEMLQTAFEVGELALSMASQQQFGLVEARVRDMVFGMVLCWRGDLRRSIISLRRNKELALHHGTFEYAGYSLLKSFAYRLFTGGNLATLERDILSAIVELENVKQTRICLYLRRDLAIVAQLRNPQPYSAALEDERFQFGQLVRTLESGRDRYGLFYTAVSRLLLATVEQDDADALRFTVEAEALRDGGPGLLHQGMVTWLGTLAKLAGTGFLHPHTLDQASKSIEQLKLWAQTSPTTWESRLLVVQAELARRQGALDLSEELFESALRKAEESGYHLDEYIVCFKRARSSREGRAHWQNRAYATLQAWRDSKTETWQVSHSREESFLRDIVRVTNSRSEGDLVNALIDLIRLRLQVRQVSIFSRDGQALSSWNSQAEPSTDLLRETLEKGRPAMLTRDDKAECSLPLMVEGKVHAVLYVVGRVSLEDTNGVALFSALKSIVELAESTLRSLEVSPLLHSSESEPVDRTDMFNTIVDESGAAQFAHDAAGRVLFANPAYSSAMGVRMGDITGKFLKDFAPPSMVDRILAMDGNVLNSGQYKESLETLTNSENDVRCYAVVRNPLKDRAGQVIGVCGTATDITSLCVTQEENQKSDRLLKLGTLADKIAHDLRNVINAVQGNVELMKLDISSDSPLYESLEEIESSSHRATELVAAVLKFCQHPAPSKHRFEICTMLEETVELVRIKHRSSIPVTIAVEEKNLILHADPKQIRQIAMNLLSNSVQACVGRNGHIEVQVRKINSQPQEDSIEIVVRDNGKGMDEPTVRKAFDAFFTTRPLEAGNGLGLSVVKAIVRAHNGRVSLKSVPDQGTEVVVLLPNEPLDYEGLLLG